MIEWGRLMADQDYRIIKQDRISDFFVSTVWLGIDHHFGGGPPWIFETMVFVNEDWEGEAPACRTPTEEAALAAHDQAVAWARENSLDRS